MIPNSYKKSKNPYRYFFIKVGVVTMAVMLVALLVADIKIYQKKKELSAQIKNLQEKVQYLKNKNNNLKEDMVRTSDNAYIEKAAREELDLQLPGEKVFSFVASASQQQNTTVQQNNWPAWVASAWNSFITIFRK